MRHIIVPVVLLAAVAFSTGVVLPQLPCQEPDADATTAQSSSDSHSQITECDVLRRLYKSKARWMFNTENNQEKYNENSNEKQGVNTHDYEPIETGWFSNQKKLHQPQNFEREYFSDGDSYGISQDQNWAYQKPKHPTIDAVYSQNKDVLIRNGHAYYLYDTYMAARSPFYYARNPQHCRYKAMLQSATNNAQPTDGTDLELQDEPERLDLNEINPQAKEEHVVDEQNDVEDIGEKELPDDLIMNEEETSEVQKKLFSFWSRLQALSHKGRQLPTRRHTFVYYGPDGTRDGPLTAETRASHLRPPGQPLRWG